MVLGRSVIDGLCKITISFLHPSNAGRPHQVELCPDQRKVLFLLIIVSMIQFSSPSTVNGTQPIPPRIIEHPSDIVVKKNEPAMLYCKADGEPKPIIEWYKDGEKVRPNRPRIFLSGDGLFIYKVVSGEGKDSDTGTYSCVARNSIGKVSSHNATVNLGYLSDEFRLTPKSGTVTASDSVTMDCSPPQGSPEPRVTWKKDGEPMNLVSPRFQLTTSGSLKINDIHPTDRGIYVCVASSSVGSRESSPASLVVLVKPYFIKVPNNVTIPELGSVEFECKVDGDPVPQITWIKKDGQLSSSRATIKADKSLRLVNVSAEDGGVYTCEAGNLVGSAFASATLSITSHGSEGIQDSSSPMYPSLAKEPYFIVGAILLMFLLCSIIMIVFARQHLGWKKAVGAYITVQLSKADELEKARHLNSTCSSGKNSWLLETSANPFGNPPSAATATTTASITGTRSTTSPIIGLLTNHKNLFKSSSSSTSSYHPSTPPPPAPPSGSNSSSIRITGNSLINSSESRGYRKIASCSSELKPFNPSHHHHYPDHLTTNLQSYPVSLEEGYYAEVEGYSSLVTFGKKDSLTSKPGNPNKTSLTSSHQPPQSQSKSNNLIDSLAPSIEPYATTNLINTFNPHPHQFMETSINSDSRACDQNHYHSINSPGNHYYGLPLTVSLNGSTGNLGNSPSQPRFLNHHPQHHYQPNNQQHISNKYHHSPASSYRSASTVTSTPNSTTSKSTVVPGTGLDYRKVILKDVPSVSDLPSKRTVLITDDLYAIPNCGPEEEDEEENDLVHIRPPSVNFFLPNT